MTKCFCCSNKDYQDCCQPFIDSKTLPKTPEQLMRSRYSAFAQKNIDYIFSTMTSLALDSADKQSTVKWLENCTWQKLEVLSATEPKNNKGEVQFIAHFEENGEAKTIHEHSFFEYINDKWLYVGATHSNHKPITVDKVGRNEPCPCGSGKKYKKCCQ
jgi:SEC-C motif domain protein